MWGYKSTFQTPAREQDTKVRKVFKMYQQLTYAMRVDVRDTKTHSKTFTRQIIPKHLAFNEEKGVKSVEFYCNQNARIYYAKCQLPEGTGVL